MGQEEKGPGAFKNGGRGPHRGGNNQPINEWLSCTKRLNVVGLTDWEAISLDETSLKKGARSGKKKRRTVGLIQACVPRPKKKMIEKCHRFSLHRTALFEHFVKATECVVLLILGAAEL